jgi:hypothetical protein
MSKSIFEHQAYGLLTSTSAAQPKQLALVLQVAQKQSTKLGHPDEGGQGVTLGPNPVKLFIL